MYSEQYLRRQGLMPLLRRYGIEIVPSRPGLVVLALPDRLSDDRRRRLAENILRQNHLSSLGRLATKILRSQYLKGRNP